MNEKGRIAVTGASGFVGKNLIQSLANVGYEIRVLSHNKNILQEKVTSVSGDLLSGEGLEEFIDGADIVIHLASLLGGSEGEVYKFNITSTKNLLSSAKGIKVIAFVSSAAVYGKTKRTPFTETDELNPDNEYAKSKTECETEVVRWAKANGVRYLILRPFNIYGPGSDHGVVASMLKSIKENGKVVIDGDPKEITRDFLYVGDFVDVLLLMLKKDVSGIYNIGWGENRSLSELVECLKKFSKKEFELKTGSTDSTKSGNIEINVAKMESDLSWKPKVNLEEGIKRTIKWFEKRK